MRALCRLTVAEASRMPPRTAVATAASLSSQAEEANDSSFRSLVAPNFPPSPLMIASTSVRCFPPFSSLQRRSVWGDACVDGLKRNGGAVEGFYDATVEQYALQPTEKLSLHQMLDFGRSALLDSSGRLLLASARHAQRELPKRLARRLMDLQLLPFIVVSNPHIRRVYDAYRHAFDTLVAFPKVETARSNLEFTELLRRLVDEHAPMLDLLASGLREVDARPFAGPRVDLDAFLDAMLRSRVSRRVLAEHHIGLAARRPGHIGAVCADVNLKEAASFASSKVRQACVEAYGVSPSVRISAGEGGGGGRGEKVSTNFDSPASASVVFSPDEEGVNNDKDDSSYDPSMPYIPAHLDYCLYELLKNAARATVEASAAKKRARGERRTLALSARNATMPSFSSSSSSSPSSAPSPFFGPLPPIAVRICDAPGKAATFRISDQGGGIPEEQAEAVWRYGFTTVGKKSAKATAANASGGGSPSSSSSAMMMMMMGESGANDPLPLSSPSSSSSSAYRMGGLGFGLPLSRLYSRYFGGDLKLLSIPGYGVDAFLTLEHLDGDWVEPADEHVPVRPSAEPRNKKSGEEDGDSGGGGKKERKAAASSHSSSSSPSPSTISSSDSAGSSKRRRRQSSDDDVNPRAALP